VTEGTLTPTKVVGFRIAQARKDRGIRQDELGERLSEYLGKSWTKQAVSEAERGNRKLDPTEFLAFAIVLDYPLAWFYLPPAGEAFAFPGRLVPLGELSDGPLIAPEDARQALFEELMAVYNDQRDALRENQQRVEALLSIAGTARPGTVAAKGDVPAPRAKGEKS
jgi:transcriptional regulator with XRE-family HTH domain